MTYTIFAPWSWACDVEPAIGDWWGDLETGRLDTKPNRAGIAEVIGQFQNDRRRVRRGGGYAIRFDLSSIDAVKFLRGEALYRFEFQGGNRNPYGNESPDGNLRRAAWKIVERCDAIIEGGAS